MYFLDWTATDTREAFQNAPCKVPDVSQNWRSNCLNAALTLWLQRAALWWGSADGWWLWCQTGWVWQTEVGRLGGWRCWLRSWRPPWHASLCCCTTPGRKEMFQTISQVELTPDDPSLIRSTVSLAFCKSVETEFLWASYLMDSFNNCDVPLRWIHSPCSVRRYRSPSAPVWSTDPARESGEKIAN